MEWSWLSFILGLDTGLVILGFVLLWAGRKNAKRRSGLGLAPGESAEIILAIDPRTGRPYVVSAAKNLKVEVFDNPPKERLN